MRLRISYTIALDTETLRALWRYCHDEKAFNRVDAISYARRVAEDVGSMGLDEQIHEGRKRLEEDEREGKP